MLILSLRSDPRKTENKTNAKIKDIEEKKLDLLVLIESSIRTCLREISAPLFGTYGCRRYSPRIKRSQDSTTYLAEIFFRTHLSCRLKRRSKITKGFVKEMKKMKKNDNSCRTFSLMIVNIYTRRK